MLNSKKKAVIVICFALSSCLIFDSFHLWHAAAMFYLAGEIPGTKTSFSPGVMMAVFAVLAGFIFARVCTRLFITRRYNAFSPEL